MGTITSAGNYIPRFPSGLHEQNMPRLTFDIRSGAFASFAIAGCPVHDIVDSLAKQKRRRNPWKIDTCVLLYTVCIYMLIKSQFEISCWRVGCLEEMSCDFKQLQLPQNDCKTSWHVIWKHWKTDHVSWNTWCNKSHHGGSLTAWQISNNQSTKSCVILEFYTTTISNQMSESHKQQ